MMIMPIFVIYWFWHCDCITELDLDDTFNSWCKLLYLHVWYVI